MSDWVQKYMARKQATAEAAQAQKGGPGSGHHGHAGRPGQRGGSAPGKGGGAAGGRERTEITEAEASDLRRLTAEAGGFTYNPIYDDSPKKGYALSIYPEAEMALLASDLTPESIYQYMVKNRDRFEDPDTYVGGWFDTENDIVYLDISLIVQSVAKAKALARKHNQEGIYDLAAGETIIVKAEEERRRTVGASASKEHQRRGPERARAGPV